MIGASRRLIFLVLGLVGMLSSERMVMATSFSPGLMDPSTQPKFEEPVAEAMADSFKVQLVENEVYKIASYRTSQETGLVDPSSGTGERLVTPVFGYGFSEDGASWPSPTLEIRKGDLIKIRWKNKLYIEGNQTGLPFTSMTGKSVVDTSVHWAYTSSIPEFEGYTVEDQGVPTVVHVHGSRAQQRFDGNARAFFNNDYEIRGSQWRDSLYVYANNQEATALWYHDHALGITRLNNYAGLQGFWILRDEFDTGNADNPLGLPAGDYEKAYAIQDRFFKENGELFYPAYKGEPYYDDFITGENANWDSDVDGPTILAEFFGDFMVVNGKIWPKQDVEPRRYRFRLLNGCDSRFLVLSFMAVDAGETSIDSGVPVMYTIVGADQGLQHKPIRNMTSSIIETGSRLDIVIDFSGYEGKRIILGNSAGDTPFSGDIPGEQVFEYTNMIMAFDVESDPVDDDTSRVPAWEILTADPDVDKVRRVGLFEGLDHFSRLQPLLGGELEENIVETFTFAEPITETPTNGTVEEWVIFNFSGDAHPIHLHRVKFRTIARYPIVYDSNAGEDGYCSGVPDHNTLDGVCLEEKESMQHGGPGGVGLKVYFPVNATGYDAKEPITLGSEYNTEIGGRRDLVTALPAQATIIRIKFDTVGTFMWHCHILSHEDSEMMRPYKIVHDRKK